MHVGQDDMEAGEVRKRLGEDKIIGVSAHSVEEACLLYTSMLHDRDLHSLRSAVLLYHE